MLLDNEELLQKLKQAAASSDTAKAAEEDFIATFYGLGVEQEEASRLALFVFRQIHTAQSAIQLENDIFARYQAIRIEKNGKSFTLPQALTVQISGRAETIFSQVSDCFTDIQGPVIDYGAGDCQVTQLLKDRLDLDIEAADVVDYRTPRTTVQFSAIREGKLDRPDGFYDAALLTNVLHHEKNNALILADIDRLVTGRIVIIETVPEGKTDAEQEADLGRTFLNDWFYNRTFHPNAGIPVPGSYETIDGWKSRFARTGWILLKVTDLGRDQPLIADRHVLFVLMKPAQTSI
ncbi:MAG: class I SAM-dependent methyltransferase [Chlorobiaceae bacterium]|jgi:hypothetical protein|nr:class I SAM-dependent methyltransferase [Chlorobiaceae bacterium]